MISKLDTLLLFSLFALTLIGYITLGSAAETVKAGSTVLNKQIVWITAGIAAGFIIYKINYRVLIEIAPIIYSLTIVLLVVVLVAGSRIHGAKSWVSLAGFTLQPSEPAKLAVILMIANLIKKEKDDFLSFNALVRIGLAVLLPVCLILLQPDFGTASTYFAIGGGAVFILGLKKRVYAVFVILFVLTGFLSWNTMFKPYQKERIYTFINPERDPLGRGYHVIQSKVAVGSGQVFGKGYRKGTQSKLKYLPEPHTDFIFAVFAEEFGFFGVLSVLGLFMIMLSRCINIARLSYDKSGMVISGAVASLILYQCIISIGMIVGLIPTTGIPLPFFSYGGSGTITYFMLIALVLSVFRKRHVSY